MGDDNECRTAEARCMETTSVLDHHRLTAFEAPPDRSTFRGEIPPAASRAAVRSAGRRRFIRPTALVAAAGTAATLAFDRVGAVLVVVLFVLVVPFEKLFPRHRKKLRREALGTDIAYALVSTPLGAIGVAVGLAFAVASFAWLPGLALRPIVGLLPGGLQAIVGLVLFDIAIYWAHRWAHEVPFLWRFHSIHHSTRHLDWISGFRNHPFDGAFFFPAFVLLLAAGFSPEFSGALAVVQFLAGLFAHANVRWRLRPLHKIVITPEFHHWHHADETAAFNKNYSVFLPAWDLLFGTYYMPADRRPTVYGVSAPTPTGIVAQLWHPLRGLRNPAWMLRHPWRGARSLAAMLRRGGRQMIATMRRPDRRHPGSYTA